MLFTVIKRVICYDVRVDLGFVLVSDVHKCLITEIADAIVIVVC